MCIGSSGTICSYREVEFDGKLRRQSNVWLLAATFAHSGISATKSCQFCSLVSAVLVKEVEAVPDCKIFSSRLVSEYHVACLFRTHSTARKRGKVGVKKLNSRRYRTGAETRDCYLNLGVSYWIQRSDYLKSLPSSCLRRTPQYSPEPISVQPHGP